MSILHLILGHLLADFVLQPFQLVRWKFHSRKGILLHSAIHFAVYALIFLPFLPDLRVIGVITAVTVAHFVIDGLKIDKEKKGSRFPSYFLLDQGIHLVTLVAGGTVIMNVPPNAVFGSQIPVLFGNFYLIFGLILLFFSTYAVEMFMFQFKRMEKAGAAFKPDYRAMLKRAIVFFALYGAFLVFGAHQVAAWG